MKQQKNIQRLQNTSSKTLYNKFDIIAAYQIIGGLVGLVLASLSIYNSSGNSSILLLIAVGFYAFSIFCGILLFINREFGLKYSLINQLLQLFNFSFAGYAFEYISGISLSVGIDFSNSFNFNPSIGISTWHILINQDTGIKEANLNLVALLCVFFIQGLKEKINL